MDRAGRVTLVRTILTSMLIYFLTVFSLKKWALKKIDKLRRSFLWKGTESANGGHCLINWKKVLLPKQMGGLGLLDLNLFSRALRLRWLWYEWSNPDRPCVGTSTPCDNIYRQLFRASTVVAVGNGTRAKFWHCSWLDGKAPMDIAPNLFKLAWRKHRTVKEELTDHSWDERTMAYEFH